MLSAGIKSKICYRFDFEQQVCYKFVSKKEGVISLLFISQEAMFGKISHLILYAFSFAFFDAFLGLWGTSDTTVSGVSSDLTTYSGVPKKHDLSSP